MKYLFTEESATAVVEETIAVETDAAPEATMVVESTTKTEEGAAIAEDIILTVGASDGEMNVLFAEQTTETVATTEAAPSLGFQPMNFVDNLQYMGVGMLTIFVVIGVIILFTTGINKVFSKKKDEE